MDRLKSVFQDVFDRQDLEIDELSRNNFPEWDSLAHVKLMIAIEEEFNSKFTIDEVSDIKSVRELRSILGSGPEEK